MSKKVITLISSDGERFEVEEAVAIQSEMIKAMMEADCVAVEDGVPLTLVKSDIMPKLIEYLKKHAAVADDNGDSSSVTDVAEWDSEFIKSVDPVLLNELILASDHLKIKNLLDLSCKSVVDMIKGKTPAQIRETFNIKNDFTIEEEKKIRRENKCFFD